MTPNRPPIAAQTHASDHASGHPVPRPSTRSHPLSLAALTLSLAVLSACAGSPRSEGTGEYVDDSVITAKVKSAVLNEPGLSSSEINVETFKGKVQLSGFVSKQSDIDRAMALARGITGVKGVNNDMRLK
jgi:BON domain